MWLQVLLKTDPSFFGRIARAPLRLQSFPDGKNIRKKKIPSKDTFVLILAADWEIGKCYIIVDCNVRRFAGNGNFTNFQIAGLLKEYLRELPEPVFSNCLYQMLVDAMGVFLPDDPDGNAKLVFSILDCLPKANRVNVFVFVIKKKIFSFICNRRWFFFLSSK